MAPYFFPVAMLFQDGPQTVQIDEKLVVRANHVNYKRDQLAFDSGVIAEYGVTTVYSDHLEVSTVRSEAGITVRRALARGNVRMVDPEGEIRASQIEFDWKDETGTALDAKLTAADMEVSAATINILKDELHLFDVSVSVCSREGVGMSFRELNVSRKGTGIGRGIRLAASNRTLLALPHYRFVFRDDGRAGGIQSPEVSLKGRYLRASWSPEIRFGERLLLDVSMAAMQGREAGGKAYLTHSFLSSGTPFRGPRAGGSEPYAYGYMENVMTRSLEREQEYVRRPRATLSLGTAWNQGRYAGQPGSISKPVEVVLEGSGPVGAWGAFGQVRFHEISVPQMHQIGRWELLGSLSPPTTTIVPGIIAFGRVDFRSALQPGEDYSWLRGQIGASFKLGKTSAISIAHSRVADRGKSLFEFDRPERGESTHVRGDFGFGPTKLSGLVKFEPGASRAYSSELYVSQLAGCLEVFALWRDTPRTFTVGFKLRSLEKIADSAERIARRTRGNNPVEPPRN